MLQWWWRHNCLTSVETPTDTCIVDSWWCSNNCDMIEIIEPVEQPGCRKVCYIFKSTYNHIDCIKGTKRGYGLWWNTCSCCKTWFKPLQHILMKGIILLIGFILWMMLNYILFQTDYLLADLLTNHLYDSSRFCLLISKLGILNFDN